MIKSFSIKNEDLESNIFPNFYLFKEKIKSFSRREDITSFSLGDKGVLKILTDGEHAGQKFVDTGSMFIKNSCVKRYNISEFEDFYITHEKNNQLKRSKLQVGDVLLTTIGYFVGNSALVNKNVENANINQNVVRIRIDENVATPQYLSCFLNSKLIRFQIDNLFSGNIYPLLTYPKLKSLKIFIKDKTVENVVTDNMIKADEKHLLSLQKIKEAQSLFKAALKVDFSSIKKKMFYSVNNSLFQSEEMMTPAFYYPLYIKTAEQIAKQNHCELLGTLAYFKKGDEVGSVNYKSYLQRNETDVPFIRTSDLLNYDIDLYPDYYIDKAIHGDIKQDIQKNEILLTKDGKIGLVAMTTSFDKCILGSGVLRIVPKEDKIDAHYLFIALSIKEIGLYQAIQRTVVASTMPHLREDRINDFKIPILKDQAKIIELTKSAFELKDEKKKIIDETRLVIEKSLDII
jgi:type I restriction enzyme S subunit